MKSQSSPGLLVRCILGIADTDYLRAWEQQCALDEVQANIREITALKAMTIAEIQYRDGRLKELSGELARLQQPAPLVANQTGAGVTAHETVEQRFTPLELETRPTTDTAAAWYLRKAPQTLRIWACRENGPIRPIRVGANLHWPVADIRRLLGVTA
ncbi:hypothetical protein [Rhodoferax sp.]|uniref:hypothetical protein n=1 Tax=Rhodoferax sp. TaxID=50421 RepID=UPI00345C05DD